MNKTDNDTARAASPASGIGGDSQPKSAMTNALWNTLGTLFSIATSFVVAPVLIRNLGTAQYGLLLLLGSIIGLLGLMNFGLGEATLRYVAHYYGCRDSVGVNRVFGSTLSFYVVVATLAAAVLLTAAPVIVTWLSISPDQRAQAIGPLRLAGLVFSAGVLTSAYAVIPLALQRYDIGSKINMSVNLVRNTGYIALAATGAGLSRLLMFDLGLGGAVLLWRMIVAKRLLPDLNLRPSFSLAGIKEIIGFSIFSFLTWSVHTMHRESGKVLLGRISGMEPVAYLGTPDSIAQRIHLVISSSSEALVPHFSANRDSKASERLFWNATWSALVMSLLLFIPFVVLVPDFLRLWINPQFSKESGFVGQLLGVYLVSQGAFAPVATYYRGIGKPWFVTVVISFALAITGTLCIGLIPAYGVTGSGYAYLAGSAAPFAGVVAGGLYAFGSSGATKLLRIVAYPSVAGVALCLCGLMVRGRFDDLNWIGLVSFGSVMLLVNSMALVGIDLLLGGDDPPSRHFMKKLAEDRRVRALIGRVRAIRASGATE